MALAFLNACGWRPASGGAGSFVYASALVGYYAPAACLAPVVVDGATYHYHAISDDGTQFEEGDGVWDAGTGTLTRADIRNSSSGGAIITFSAAPRVIMGGPLAGDMPGWKLISEGAVATPTSQIDITIPAGYRAFRLELNALKIDAADIQTAETRSLAVEVVDDGSTVFGPALLFGDWPLVFEDTGQVFEITISSQTDFFFDDDLVAFQSIKIFGLLYIDSVFEEVTSNDPTRIGGAAALVGPTSIRLSVVSSEATTENIIAGAYRLLGWSS